MEFVKKYIKQIVISFIICVLTVGSLGLYAHWKNKRGAQ